MKYVLALVCTLVLCVPACCCKKQKADIPAQTEETVQVTETVETTKSTAKF